MAAQEDHLRETVGVFFARANRGSPLSGGVKCENGTGNPEDKTDRMEINTIKTENIRLNLKIIKNSIDKTKIIY